MTETTSQTAPRARRRRCVVCYTLVPVKDDDRSGPALCSHRCYLVAHRQGLIQTPKCTICGKPTPSPTRKTCSKACKTIAVRRGRYNARRGGAHRRST